MVKGILKVKVNLAVKNILTVKGQLNDEGLTNGEEHLNGGDGHLRYPKSIMAVNTAIKHGDDGRKLSASIRMTSEQ